MAAAVDRVPRLLQSDGARRGLRFHLEAAVHGRRVRAEGVSRSARRQARRAGPLSLSPLLLVGGANNCYLQDLFADPEVRGKGVGAALIEAVRKEAGKLGVSNVYWMTHETNAAARRLYDRVARKTGFIEYDLLPG